MKFHIDPHPFSRGGSVAICTISLLHIYQAVMLLIYPDTTGGATCLIALLRVMHSMDSPDGGHFVAGFMLISAAMGLIGAMFRLGWIRLIIFLPQHFLLGVMAGGGVLASVLGRYLDGTVIPWQHISVDQMGLVALFLVHTSAILRRCWDPNG